MDVAIITTYRCNSRCSMCYVWQNPTLPQEEISLETMEKLPNNIDYLNITGGEPTLRKDLLEIADILYPKAMQFEISSNGLYPERIEPIIKKYPDVKIRFSLEGFELTNNKIRGEKDGFNKKVNGLLRLKELGGKDLGFAVTIQDDNAAEIVDLFKFVSRSGFELATSTLHNGFQFHKSDNVPYSRLRVARHIEGLIIEMLKTNNVKNWFRAYLNLGLIAKVLGHERLLKCTAATDFVFVDPWSDVFACNVRPDLKLGNLERQSWDELFHNPRLQQIREKVNLCKQNCWMVGSAKTAMRHPKYARIPKGGPFVWVVKNKLKVMLGLEIKFQDYVDYSKVHQDDYIPVRDFFLAQRVKRKVQTRDGVHYYQRRGFFNN